MNTLFDLTKVHEGNIIIRVCGEIFGKACFDEAEVATIRENVITCKVYVDLPRTMDFFQSNGVNINGKKFGYLINQNYNEVVNFDALRSILKQELHNLKTSNPQLHQQLVVLKEEEEEY